MLGELHGRNTPPITGLVVGLGLVLIGCGRISGPAGGVVTIDGGNSKNASEERDLTAPHVAGSGLDVSTNVGSIEVSADPSLKEVMVTAKVTGYGDSEEEAKARLQEIKIKVHRRDDRVLEVTAEHPKEWQGFKGACSFVVRIPQADGVSVRTGNGSVTLKGLGGAAHVNSGVGSITISDQGGKVEAQTGNGGVYVNKSGGDVFVSAAVGPISVKEAVGSVKAKTGNGSLEAAKIGGTVEANASVGSVTIRGTGGAVTASTGNGAITITDAKGAAKADASVGPVTLEQVAGAVEAETGNGSLNYSQAPGSDSPFNLKASVGSITVRLAASAGGTIQADTSVGSISVGGRRNSSVSGDRGSKRIVLTEKGPESKIRTGNGSITITLE